MKAFCRISLFVMSAFSTFVAAQAPEPPASILIEYRDPGTNRLIPSLGGLKTGQEVIATVKAFDRFGNRITNCTPKIDPIQGVSGDQLKVDDLGDGTHLVTGGQGFGSAELRASCAEFPNHFSKEFVAVSGDLRPAAAQQQAAPRSSPVGPSSSGSDAAVGTAIAVGAIAAGVGLAAVIAAAAAGGSDDNCPSFSDCCPGGGGGGGCGVPADCNCPSGTTNQGICNSAGCGAFIGIGNRSCTCN